MRSTAKCKTTYFCREDGVAHLLEIKDKVGQMLDVAHRVDLLKVNTDISFATLDVGLDLSRDTDMDMKFAAAAHKTSELCSAEVLLAGGDLSDGGPWSFDARGAANGIDTISN